MTCPILARRDQIRTVANRHASIPVSEPLIARAETDYVMAWVAQCHPLQTAQNATRLITEATAQLIAVRTKGDSRPLANDDSALRKLETECNEVEIALGVLRDQLNACHEDRFDRQDKSVRIFTRELQSA